MNIKLLVAFPFIVNIIQCIATNESARKENENKLKDMFKGKMKDGVEIQANKKIKVLVRMKKDSRNRIDVVETLSKDSYMTIERLGVFAKYLSYEELLEIEEDIEMIEMDEDNAYNLKDEYHINNDLEDQNERRLAGKVPWGIKEVLQDGNFWKSKVPSGKMKICVVDTGYDLGHEDLPVKPDVIGSNTPNITEKWSYDGHGHGTHVAGTIAATGGNGKGVKGIFPDNKEGKFQLIIGKAFDKTGLTSESKVLSAVENCVSDGANVINLSLGSYTSFKISSDYYKDLYDNKGILIFAASGNDGEKWMRYPASYPSVVSVSAMKRNLSHVKWSNYNSQVELTGPGTNIKSTWRKNQYEEIDGTSMAVPHIAGITGLLWMHFPECKNHQIRNVLADTAMNLASSGCDDRTGFGFVQSIAAYKRLELGDCGGYKPSSNNPRGGCGLDTGKSQVNVRDRLRKNIIKQHMKKNKKKKKKKDKGGKK